MNRKLIQLVIALLMIGPFYVAYLSPSDNNVINLISFVSVVIGGGIISLLMLTGGKNEAGH